MLLVQARVVDRFGGPVPASDVIRELNELRRGRGLAADDLHGRIGPRLRARCSIADVDPAAVARRKLVLRLTELCGRLPEDLRLAALAAFALHEEAEGQFLDRRIEWLASHFDRDPRTARRRVDEAFKLLAEQLEDQGGDSNTYAPSGWYTQSLRAVLRMDRDPPQLTEERRIVATTDELDELVVSLSAPRGAHISDEERIRAEMVYGGEIVSGEHVGSGHAQFTVRLPQPLSLGQPHDYSLLFTSYPRSWMQPYYVLHPLRRCDHFSVRVRFGLTGRPDKIWRLNGVPTRVVDDFKPNDDLLTLDRVGEVGLEFHALREGFSYGLQWLVDVDGSVQTEDSRSRLVPDI